MTTVAAMFGMIIGSIITQALPHYFLLQEMRKQHELQVAEIKRQNEFLKKINMRF